MVPDGRPGRVEAMQDFPMGESEPHGAANRTARKRVAVLISGRGSNMAALIEAARDRAYPAEMAMVLANSADAAGLARGRAAGIATAIVDHTRHAADRHA